MNNRGIQVAALIVVVAAFVVGGALSWHGTDTATVIAVVGGLVGVVAPILAAADLVARTHTAAVATNAAVTQLADDQAHLANTLDARLPGGLGPAAPPHRAPRNAGPRSG